MVCATRTRSGPRTGRRAAADRRPAPRPHAPACSTARGERRPWACPASCTSAAPALARGYLDRPGADGRAVRARPLRGGAREPGSTAPATWCAGGRTAARVPGPRRPPGEDPRLPRRAGRGRGAPCSPTRGARGRGRGPRRPAWATGGWWPTCRRPGTAIRGSGAARAPAPPAARVHGARRLRACSSRCRSPPTARWTARPCPRRQAREPLGRRSAAPRRPRRSAGRDLGRGARASSGSGSTTTSSSSAATRS